MKSKYEIIKSNLTDAKQSKLVSEAVICGQVEELSHLVLRDGLSFSQAVDEFRYVFDASFLSKEFLLYASYISPYYLSDFLRIDDLFDDSSITSYLKNRYSTEALDRFINICGGESELEADFNSVCESVYSGRSNYAVIPFSNTSDGLHVSLYKLILKYDLKIVASTNVIMADGITESKFVLLAKNDIVSSKATNALISFTAEIDSFLPKLLQVISNSDIKVKMINTLPLEYTDDRYEIIIDFYLNGFEINAFNLFVKSALPDCNIIGMYYTIK